MRWWEQEGEGGDKKRGQVKNRGREGDGGAKEERENRRWTGRGGVGRREGRLYCSAADLLYVSLLLSGPLSSGEAFESIFLSIYLFRLLRNLRFPEWEDIAPVFWKIFLILRHLTTELWKYSCVWLKFFKRNWNVLGLGAFELFIQWLSPCGFLVFHENSLQANVFGFNFSSPPQFHILERRFSLRAKIFCINPLTPRRTLVAPFTKISILF